MAGKNEAQDPMELAKYLEKGKEREMLLVDFCNWALETYFHVLLYSQNMNWSNTLLYSHKIHKVVLNLFLELVVDISCSVFRPITTNTPFELKNGFIHVNTFIYYSQTKLYLCIYSLHMLFIMLLCDMYPKFPNQGST